MNRTRETEEISVAGLESSPVAKMVHVLWFIQEGDQENNTELLIGVYDSEAGANAAIERLRSKPGFVDFPDGFTIAQYELGRDRWTEGFVRGGNEGSV